MKNSITAKLVFWQPWRPSHTPWHRLFPSLVFSFSLLLISFAGTQVSAQPSDSLNDIESKLNYSQEDKTRLRNLRESIGQLQQDLEQIQTQRASLLKELEASERRMSELNIKARKLEEQLRKKSDKVSSLKKQKHTLEEERQAQRQAVGQHIRAAHRMGELSNLRLILSQENPSEISRNLRYLNYVMESRARKIQQFNATLASLTAIETELETETQRLESTRRQLTEQQHALSLSQQKREKTLVKLNSTIKSHDQKLNVLTKDRKNLLAVLSRVSQQLSATDLAISEKRFSQLKGRLPWPTTGKVIKSFGSPRVSKALRWEGMLIRSETGQEVRSVHHGRVVFSDYLRGHGLLIIIDHGANYLTLYAHNEALYKELGEWVKAGDVIATVGNSGGQAHAALYFELRHKGQPANPKVWLKSA